MLVATAVARTINLRLVHQVPGARCIHLTRISQPSYYVSRLRNTPLSVNASAKRAFSATQAKGEATSGPGPTRRFSRLRTIFKYGAFLAGSTVVGCLVVTGAIFLHDAFTYTEMVRRFSASGIHANTLSLSTYHSMPSYLLLNLFICWTAHRRCTCCPACASP